MKKLKESIRSEFFRNVLTLFSGSSFAQLIPLLVSPFLTRIYQPEQFGELGLILSVIGIFSIVATLQYESAIMLPKEDEDAFNLMTLSFVLAVVISLFSFAITTIFGVQIGQLLNSKSFVEWAFIIPIFVLLTGLYNTLNIWASRNKQFKRLALRQIGQATAGASTKLGLGVFGYLNSGLILGSLSGLVTSTAILFTATIKDSGHYFSSVSWDRIKENAIRYQDFPKYTMWQGFFDLFNASGVVFILSSYYGIAVVGLYTFTLGLLQRPSKLIGSSVAQVFYQQASRKAMNGEPIYNDTLRMVKNLAAIGSVIFLPTLLAGPYLFSFVFGDKWWDAGVIAQIISPWLIMRFLAAPLANIAMIKKKQKQFLFVSTGMNLLLPAIFLVVGILKLDYVTAFYIASATMVIYLLVTVKWVLKFSKE